MKIGIRYLIHRGSEVIHKEETFASIVSRDLRIVLLDHNAAGFELLEFWPEEEETWVVTAWFAKEGIERI